MSCKQSFSNGNFILEHTEASTNNNVIIIYLSLRVFKSCRRLPEARHHSSLFFHRSGSKFLVVMVACTPSIHVFLGRPLFLIFHGIQSIINFGIIIIIIIIIIIYIVYWVICTTKACNMPACKIYNNHRRSKIHKIITNKLRLNLFRGKLLRGYLTVPTVN